jgi:hypothetical protein
MQHLNNGWFKPQATPASDHRVLDSLRCGGIPWEKKSSGFYFFGSRYRSPWEISWAILSVPERPACPTIHIPRDASTWTWSGPEIIFFTVAKKS